MDKPAERTGILTRSRDKLLDEIYSPKTEAQ